MTTMYSAKDHMRLEIMGVITTMLSCQGLTEKDVALKLDEDLGADSLDVAELTMELEYRFGVSIPDCDMFKKSAEITVGDVVDAVMKRHGLFVTA